MKTLFTNPKNLWKIFGGISMLLLMVTCSRGRSIKSLRLELEHKKDTIALFSDSLEKRKTELNFQKELVLQLQQRIKTQDSLYQGIIERQTRALGSRVVVIKENKK